MESTTLKVHNLTLKKNPASAPSPEEISRCNLLLQLSETSYGFGFFDRKKKELIYADRYYYDRRIGRDQLIRQIHDIHERNDLLRNAQPKEVRVLINNGLFTLIPHKLFDRSATEDYLSFSDEFNPKKDVVLTRLHKSIDIMHVFAADKSLMARCNEMFGSGEVGIYHNSFGLIETATAQTGDHSVYLWLHLSSTVLSVIVCSTKGLIQCKSFTAKTGEDVLYFASSVLQQLQPKIESPKILLSGDFNKEDGVHLLLSEYIGETAYVDLSEFSAEDFPGAFDYYANLTS